MVCTHVTSLENTYFLRHHVFFGITVLDYGQTAIAPSNLPHKAIAPPKSPKSDRLSNRYEP
ncbi:MAG: hypothetical protein AAGF75_06325 [Cyanobacteria bacterium P01_H01_bin.130]